MAVSGSCILAAVNTAMKVWDKSGNLLVGPKSLPAFFAYNPGCLSYVSDPFAGYDAVANQFMIGALTYDNSYNSTICIAVTGDPTGVWYLYAFPVTPASNLLDFPHVAIGSDATYLAGNQFLYGGILRGRASLCVRQECDVRRARGEVHVPQIGGNAAGHTADSLYPTQAVAIPNTAYFISANNCGGCKTISLWKWSDPFGASTFTPPGRREGHGLQPVPERQATRRKPDRHQRRAEPGRVLVPGHGLRHPSHRLQPGLRHRGVRAVVPDHRTSTRERRRWCSSGS